MPAPATISAPITAATPAAPSLATPAPQGLANLPIQSAPTPPADFIDIRGPIAPDFWAQYGTAVWVSALVALVVVAAVWFAARRFLRKRTPPPTPAEIAQMRIRAAQEAFAGDDRAYSEALSNAVRFYIERALDLPAPERTTEEFLREASAHPLLRGKPIESLGKFLEGCDLVKFARAPLDAKDRADFAKTASEFVESTEAALHPQENDSGAAAHAAQAGSPDEPSGGAAQ